MRTWLYQMNQSSWSPNRYRVEIWEGVRWRWPVLTQTPANKELEPGDIVVFFYARTGGDDPGFYGWAVVLEWYAEERFMYFMPTAPSDHLKMHPWWDDAAEGLANRIRGKVKQRNAWLVPDDLVGELREGITSWVAWTAAEE